MLQKVLHPDKVGRLVRYYCYSADGRITSAGTGIVVNAYETFTCYGDNSICEILIEGGSIEPFRLADLKFIEDTEDGND